MANEFKHGSVGTQLTQAEWESTTGHVLDSQATGDIIYASSATQLSRLGIGSTGQVLKVSGGVPTWGTDTTNVAASALTGTTMAANVVTSSLTTVGTLINLTVTNPIAGSVTGSAATVTGAAQSAITSVGTLTDLTVDNISINGTTIGHTSDTDLLTFASGNVTVAGQVLITSAGAPAIQYTGDQSAAMHRLTDGTNKALLGLRSDIGTRFYYYSYNSTPFEFRNASVYFNSNNLYDVGNAASEWTGSGLVIGGTSKVSAASGAISIQDRLFVNNNGSTSLWYAPGGIVIISDDNDNQTDCDIIFGSNSTTNASGMDEIMRLCDPDGSYPSRVGIGTTTPDYALDVHSSTAGFRVKTDSGNAYIVLDAATDAYLQFRRAGTAKWAFINDYAGTDYLALYNYNNSSTNVSIATNGTWYFHNNEVYDIGHANSEWSSTGIAIASATSATWLSMGVPLPGSGTTTFEGGMRVYASSGTDDRSWAIWADAHNPRALQIEYSGARGTGFGSGTIIATFDYQGGLLLGDNAYLAFGSDGSHSIDVNAGYMDFKMPANEDFYWKHGSTTAMFLDTSGYSLHLGLNNTASGELRLYGGASGNAEGGELKIYTSADHDTSIDYYWMDANSDDFRFGRAGVVDLLFRGGTNVWEMYRHLYMNNQYFYDIGHADSYWTNDGAKFASANVGVKVYITSSGTNSYPSLRFTNDAREWRIYGSDGSQSDSFVIYDGTGAATRFKIDTSGDSYTNDGTIHSLSDSRLKKEVYALNDGLSIIEKLRPVEFQYNGSTSMTPDDGSVHYGFLADEVQEVAPQYVKEVSENIGGVLVDDIKTMSTTMMIPMLIKSIQELSERVKTLES